MLIIVIDRRIYSKIEICHSRTTSKQQSVSIGYRLTLHI